MNNDNGGRAVERLLLNCDMGESFGSWRMGLDAEVMPYICLLYTSPSPRD